MRYRIVAVGALRRGYARSGCRHYQERLTPLAPVEVIETRPDRSTDAATARAREGDGLLRRIDGRLVALDEQGRAWRTEALARHVAELELRGTSRLTILIGGAEGLDPEVRRRADEVWRLSELTLPHDLSRLVLLEQLYRIETMRAGHPYHRG